MISKATYEFLEIKYTYSTSQRADGEFTAAMKVGTSVFG